LTPGQQEQKHRPRQHQPRQPEEQEQLLEEPVSGRRQEALDGLGHHKHGIDITKHNFCRKIFGVFFPPQILDKIPLKTLKFMCKFVWSIVAYKLVSKAF
jgi:hypothetical protein